MAERVIKLPDVGEGVAEAELVEWHVKIGDLVREDQLLAAVMTDKATVEIPSPVDGEIVWLGAEVGDTVAVGSPIVRLKVAGEGSGEDEIPPHPASAPLGHPLPVGERNDGDAHASSGAEAATPLASTPQRGEDGRAERRPGEGEVSENLSLSMGAPRAQGERPLASPAVRLRAKEAGLDLRQVRGTGPAGRITHEDLDAAMAGPQQAGPAVRTVNTAVEEVKIVGLRRRIAEKMSLAASRIPHITYVEEVDMTALEALRGTLNAERRADRPKLTILPFLMRALVKAVGEQPGLNAHFDDEAGVLRKHGAVHIGIAAQTVAGLMVPVVRHAEARDIWSCASEIARLSEAAKAGTAQRDELSGSTITITSLGAMGGVVTTPIINHPEVAIVGVNKMMTRPLWDGTRFVPRAMMNLSSSFDHRVVDGWDAAVFVQRIKVLLETPALLFIEE